MKYICTALLVALLSLGVTSCKEEIDKSNRYTFTEYTILSYLEEHEQYSEYLQLLHDVKISSFSESTVAQLLSARGHFTCFAPNNDAIHEYLDSLVRKGIITSASWEGFRSDHQRDSIKQVIVYNSIIDGGDVQYFETSAFGAKGEEISISNMNDRRMSTYRGDVNSDSIYINKYGECPISMQNRDIEAINGRIHEVLQVIAPSNDSMADVLRQWMNEGGSNYTVMARLILACGLSDTLGKIRDEEWEERYMTGRIEDIGDFDSSNPKSGIPPEHRKYGFTIFAETDDVWEAEIGKPAADISVEDVKAYLIGKGIYAGASTEKDYEDTHNIINLFTTYHILPARISRDKLIIHYNEKGYNWKSSRSYTVATEEFYTTMGKPRLLKVYESFESNGIYLNRFPILRNGRGDYAVENLNVNDYHESGRFQNILGHSLHADENEGILVENNTDATTTTENVINGIIYPIKKVLALTENIETQLQRQRIRFDLASMLPELMSNDLRRPLVSYPTGHASYRAFPTSYQYLNNIEIKEGTRFYYLNGLDRNWYNWQGDEFNIIGRYEFIIKLPPVPKAGHYELRLAVQSNSNLRGMCQVYWGPDKNNLPAIGIPLDMRMGGEYRRLKDSTQPSIVGWQPDTGDQEIDDEVDKKMRNNGFMKGPEHYSAVPGSTTTIRAQSDAIRRIMVSADMDPDVTYYLKFKSVLDDELKQFFIDYIEYCAKEVYDNPVESEDIW